MGLFVYLIKENLVPLIGIFTYGLMVIVLTILGGKLLQGAGLIRFDAEDSGQTGLAKAIVISVLAISFSIIIAINTYRPAPAVVLAEDTIKRGGGGCGSKGGASGGAANKTGGQPVSSSPCGN